ncbi:MAG: DUF819 family protein [Elusimicrobiota bacterium]
MPTIILFFALLGLVSGVLFLERVPAFKKLYHYLPSAFWCYFLPMLLATAGLLPTKSPVYDFLTTYVLSACLVLLLLNINLPAILKLGPIALSSMAVGAGGITVGAVASYSLFVHWLPPETWKGVGALSASWIGGSANMLAVKEALQTPEAVFAPMVIVDTVITYSWMGILVALAAWQEPWDRWVKADRSTLDDVVKRIETIVGSSSEKHHSSPLHALWLIGLGIVVGAGCLKLGQLLPHRSSVLSASGWAFLLVTAIGILLSFTPATRLEKYGASRWGYFCLYLLLAAMGSNARLQYIFQAPLLIVMAYVLVLMHALLLALYGYFFHVPMFFLVTASQANIGGTASTPIVAGVYQPRLAPLGLLLAIAGNVIGTYAGVLIAKSCFLAHQ